MLIRLRRVWAVIAAAISYTTFGIGALLLGLVFRLIDWLPLSLTKKQRWIRHCIHISCLSFINLMRFLGLLTYQLSVTSTDKVKESGCIVVANHPSLIDAVFILAANKNISCIVKGALWNNFFTSAVVKLAGYIPNDSKDFIEIAVEKLRMGDSILIFPEGTRNTYNEQLDFRRGAANIAVVANAPILPVLITSNPRALQKGEKWYSIPDGGSHFSIQSGDLLNLTSCIDVTRPRTVQYRHLTRYLKKHYLAWLANTSCDKPKHEINIPNQVI